MKAYQIALGGVLAAMAVVVLCLGGVLPLATYVCPALAGVLVLPVTAECGKKLAWAFYGAVSLLALLLVPDKEVALLYLCYLGCYPLWKPALDRVWPKLLGWGLKLLLCSGAVAAAYGLLILLLGLAAVAASFGETTTALLVGVIVLAEVAFVLYDRLLGRLTVLYEKKIRPKLRAPRR